MFSLELGMAFLERTRQFPIRDSLHNLNQKRVRKISKGYLGSYSPMISLESLTSISLRRAGECIDWFTRLAWWTWLLPLPGGEDGDVAAGEVWGYIDMLGEGSGEGGRGVQNVVRWRKFDPFWSERVRRGRFCDEGMISFFTRAF